MCPANMLVKIRTIEKHFDILNSRKVNLNMKIYHNPRCAKSRDTLKLLQINDINPEIFLYLDCPVDASELKRIIQLLKIKPEQLVRKNEPVYKELFKGRQLSDTEWINALVKYPKLIERPIVIAGDKVVIGRPPENVLDLI